MKAPASLPEDPKGGEVRITSLRDCKAQDGGRAQATEQYER